MIWAIEKEAGWGISISPCNWKHWSIVLNVLLLLWGNL